MALVWMDSWQMECCGDPFAVGDSVNWNLTPQVDDEWLTAALGAALADEISLSEEHHDERREVPPTRVTVRGIRCAYCEYGPHPDLKKTLYPIPGTTELIQITQVDGSESRLSKRQFIGYVIEVDPAT